MSRQRPSAAQRRVLNTAGVTHLGWDEANRPVVAAKSRWSPAIQRWAVSQKGDPMEITGQVRKEF